MALIIEDGSIVTDANSYVTIEEYANWADARFGAVRDSKPALDAKLCYEGFILRATDYFETLSFKGSKVQSDQPLQWPRSGVVIDGFKVSSTSIPKEVKTSIFELAYAEEQQRGQLDPLERGIKSEKIDVIEVTYADNASSRCINVAVSATLKKLLDGFGGANFSVSRV